MRALAAIALAGIALAGCSSGDREETSAMPVAAVADRPVDAAPHTAPTMGKVDCAPVAAHLTTLSKRDIEATAMPAAAKKTAMVGATSLQGNIKRTCERLWNDDTRRCLLAASDATSVSACKKYQVSSADNALPAPVEPDDHDPTCDAVIIHLLNLATREIAASPAIPTSAKGTATAQAGHLAIVLEPMCLRGWPGPLKRCVMHAQTALDLDPCRRYMPESLKKLEQQLRP